MNSGHVKASFAALIFPTVPRVQLFHWLGRPVAAEDTTSSMGFETVHSSEFGRITSDDQFKQRNGVRVVENQSVVCVLESSLHFPDVVGALANINFTVLRVLDA